MPFDDSIQPSLLGMPSDQAPAQPPKQSTPSGRPYKKRRKRGEGKASSMTPGARRCPKCSVWRPGDTFGKYKTCQSCRDAGKSYHLENLAERRQEDVARVHKVDLEEYRALLDKQKGKCALCGHFETHQKENGQIYALCVDHDHFTGKIRGLICFRCNQLVAYLESSDWKTIQRAWYYMTGMKV